MRKQPDNSPGDSRDRKNDTDTQPVIVGIGASAGGLEALQALLPGLPTDTPITYVIVQHMDPTHPSMLVSLLRRHTKMPVREIADRDIPEPNRIYITPPGQNLVVSGGALRLSSTVTSLGPKPSIDLFSPISKKWRIFRQRNGNRRTNLPLRHQMVKQIGGRISPAGEAKDQFSARDTVKETLLEAFANPAVLIDDRLQALHFRGDTSAYLRPPEGDANLDIIQMAKDSIRLDLRTLVHKSMREKKAHSAPPIRIRSDGEDKQVVIHSTPVDRKNGPGDLLLVVFETLKPYQYVQRGDAESDSDDPRVYEIEQELNDTRDRLQTTIEELETTNEELMSLNEELQSANEELQSSNEELETTTEELQSTNEELNTVNDEMQAKSAELAATNADMENILTQIGIPLVIVDRDLRIVRFNDASMAIFKLHAGDIGQVITTIRCHYDITEFRTMLRTVVDGGKARERELSGGQQVFFMRVHPHLDKRDRTIGAMLLFIDKTAIAKKTQDLETIGRISRLFLSSTDINNVFENLPGLLARQFRMPHVSIELYDAEKNEMRVAGYAGDGPKTYLSATIPADKTVCGDVIGGLSSYAATGEAIEEDGCRHPLIEGVSAKTMICLPVAIKQKPIGVIVLADTRERDDVVRSVHTLEVIGNHLALEIDRMQTAKTLITRTRELENLARNLEKQTARLEASNKELDEFAYAASHDLQEPLRKIQIFSGMIRDRYADNLDETGNDYIQRINKATRRMRMLLDALLTYSRVTNKGMSFASVDLKDVLARALSEMEVAIQEKKASIQSEGLTTIEAEPRQIRQLFENLVGNAIKYNTSETPTVRITADIVSRVPEGRERAVDHCRIRVSDNGIGFDPKYAEKIFNPFQRLHSAKTYKGSGVGLAICKKIVLRHNGTIQAKSNPGEGAEFIVTLPVQQGKQGDGAFRKE